MGVNEGILKKSTMFAVVEALSRLKVTESKGISVKRKQTGAHKQDVPNATYSFGCCIVGAGADNFTLTDQDG